MSTTALVGGRLLDGSGGPPVAGATVVFEDARIVAVGPDAAVPGEATVVDVSGSTITPGLIDAHVHLGFASSPAQVVDGGVTAVRDLGWPADRLVSLRRRAWAAGLLVQTVGQILTAPGGYPTTAGWAPKGTGREVATVAEAEAAVDQMVAAGACAIKIAMEPRAGPMLPDDVLAAIVRRAADHGRFVTAHVGSAEAMAACVEAGVAELAHIPLGLDPLPDALVARAVAAGVVAVPTLHCRDADPDHGRAGRTALRQWVAAGGRVVYGTDLGNARTGPGADARELSLLVEAGLPPAAVIVAATSAAAAQIGVGDVTGRVAPGLRADLLVLDRDPLADVTALARPSIVIANGRLLRRRRLASTLRAMGLPTHRPAD